MNSLVASARQALSRSAAACSRNAERSIIARSSSSLFSTSTSTSSASDASPPPPPSESELEAMLRKALPGSKQVSVKDTSGGCGTMYEISVSASEFAGLSKVKQHKLVAAALPVKSWHGFVLNTSIP